MFEEKVRVYKVRPTAKLPRRAHPADAGMDFFFAPENRDPVFVDPGQSKILGTGIKMQVPSGYMLQIMNKSGVAAKRSLVTGACVVDQGYTGEIFVNLHNIGTETQMLEPGVKLAQGVFIEVLKPELVEVKEDNIYGKSTDRGAGALGSTGST